MTLAEQLAPNKVRVSPKFTAILGFILDQKWTDPAVAELCITSDGVLMARHEDELGMDHILGEKSDLVRNLEGVAQAVGMTRADTQALLDAAAAHITDWSHA